MKAALLAGPQVDLPEGAQRVAVTANALETEAEILSLKGSDAVMLLLNMPLSQRVQASRRVFEILKLNEINVSCKLSVELLCSVDPVPCARGVLPH